jgi:hypothetical protein
MPPGVPSVAARLPRGLGPVLVAAGTQHATRKACTASGFDRAHHPAQPPLRGAP